MHDKLESTCECGARVRVLRVGDRQVIVEMRDAWVEGFAARGKEIAQCRAWVEHRCDRIDVTLERLERQVRESLELCSSCFNPYVIAGK